MALKELEVRYASKRQKDYKLADAEGLYVLVRPNGSKLWRLKYRFGGKEKLLSLGAYPQVSLADARLRRAEAKVALGQGRDPGAKDTPARGMTFEEAVRAWHANRLSSLEPGHAERLMTRLERDAFPTLGAKQLKEITNGDAVAMVRSVEARGALDVSRRLKQHVGQIYRFAVPQGWAELRRQGRKSLRLPGRQAGAAALAEHHDLCLLPHGLSGSTDCARLSWARLDLGERG